MRTVPLPIYKLNSPKLWKGKEGMAENILKLKKQAVAAGMAKADAMKADRKTLNDFLSGDHNKPAKKSAVKKATKKAAKKSTKGTKVPTRKAQTRKPTQRENTDGMGRLSINKSGIDWTVESDEWNPRKDGPVEKLFKALKRSKGNIDKAYALVKDNPHEFVGKKKRNGEKRTKGEIEAMLRYRLNRTLFEYAVRTGQHSTADAKNRAEYGTGVYASAARKKTTRKASTKAKTRTKASTKKSGAKRGRKATKK